MDLSPRGGLLLTRYFFWRRKISQLLPGSKVRLFSVLGNVRDLTSVATKNNRLLFVYFLQLCLAYAKMFPKEKLFCIWMFFHPLIFITKADAIEEVLSSTKLIEKSYLYRWLEPILGTGILSSPFYIWKPRRKILNNCFRYEFLKEHLPILNEKSQFLVKCLKEETCKDFTKIVKPISLCALDIISETILGIHIGAQESKKEPEFIHSAK
ncbi:cytochrome P450 4V2, partial [Trichonephila clavata]